MKNFLVTETERIEILKRHRSLLKEQYQAPTEKELIEAGLMAGCFGSIGQSKNPIEAAAFLQGKGGQSRKSGKYIFEKPSKSKPGLMIRYLPDATYFFYNPKTQETSKIYSLPNGCPAITNYKVQVKPDAKTERDLQFYKDQGFKTPEELAALKQYPGPKELENPALWDKEQVGNIFVYKKKGTVSGQTSDPNNQIRQQYAQQLEADGYDIDPTDTEKGGLSSIRFYDAYPNAPRGIFPDNQLIWYKLSSNTSPDIIKQRQADESMERSACKDSIESFYDEFIITKGTQITDRGKISRMRTQAQRCKNKYEGKWGLGGGKFDEMLKVLSGRKSGGPSSSGDDAIFRLQ